MPNLQARWEELLRELLLFSVLPEGSADPLGNSSESASLVSALGALNLIQSFNWNEWLSARGGWPDRDEVRDLDILECIRTITALSRSERFNSGTLSSATRTGFLQALVKRAQKLAGGHEVPLLQDSFNLATTHNRPLMSDDRNPREGLNSMTSSARKLALAIGSCENFTGIVSGIHNECSDVVTWQYSQHATSDVEAKGLASVLHRPEPWAGNLTTAPIMFLSSNPSFDAREHFPTAAWSEDDVADFFINRFTSDGDRVFGATEGPGKDDLDRAILRDGSRTGRVRTWYSLRQRAAWLLDIPVHQALASRDYVMTEVVHCKSRNEVGVSSALPVCVTKWFEPMLNLSAARLVVVSGAPAGMAVKTALPAISNGQVHLRDDWGSWSGDVPGLGRWPKSWSQLAQWNSDGLWGLDDQKKHLQSVFITLNGTQREFVFLWMPHPVRSVPQTLTRPDLYSPEFLGLLRKTVAS